MDFMSAVKTCLQKYVDFNGRAARPEFWWFMLFGFIANLISEILGLVSPTLGTIGAVIVTLGLMLPGIAAGTRRLHDGDRSGWWQLIAITVIGLIPLIYFWAQKGTDGDNRFGARAG